MHRLAYILIITDFTKNQCNVNEAQLDWFYRVGLQSNKLFEISIIP